MISSISIPLSTLIAILTLCCLLATWSDQQSLYFLSTLLFFLAIITELLLRRGISRRQHSESLALAISWITLSIF